ncbi:ICP22 family protein [Tersicoccus phoenicis]|uniref:hypothetical protein n=1 Tax=Tersicoccus phoenicis TaxID=554083 RepID=UPI001F2922D3|nr:hypothetical protein [Tersicoccus phoenicis]
MVRAQLRTLESTNAEWVAKHLVMAGRYLDVDPALAFAHALAASRRGGRIAAVREAVGITAYEAGDFAEALRELRTFRRISGSNEHLALMADCERGLGRPEKAIELAGSVDVGSFDAATRVEVAMVVSGAYADLGRSEEALATLEIPQLDINRAFSFSPRLFLAYADALDAVGRTGESERWRLQSERAEQALGVGDFAEPDIIDLGEDEPEERPRRDRYDGDRRDVESGPGGDSADSGPGGDADASDTDAPDAAADFEDTGGDSEDSAPDAEPDSEDSDPGAENAAGVGDPDSSANDAPTDQGNGPDRDAGPMA